MINKIIVALLVMAVFVMTPFALSTNSNAAGKPASNLAGAQNVGWKLSAAVMPVPPYGSLDIPGSDTASKLIFNQPNGKVSAMVTGVMNGLHPNTTYTVYLSNSYTPFVAANITGITGFDFEYLDGPYVHDATLSQTGLAVTGNGGYPAGGTFSYAWSITSGSVVGNHVHLVMDYTHGASCTMTMDGDVAAGGTISGGIWSDNCFGARSGTWASVGMATFATGSTGWSGQLAGTTPFTFTTDSLGSGSWHYNFTGSVPDFSVWINEAGGTMLISNNTPATP